MNDNKVLVRKNTCKCGNVVSCNGPVGKIVFKHKFVSLEIWKKWNECDKCAIRDFLTKFDLFSISVLSITLSGDTAIDWKNFVEHEISNSHQYAGIISNVLVPLKIISCDAENNWNILSTRCVETSLCPRKVYKDMPLYFTNLKDAIEYSKIKKYEHIKFSKSSEEGAYV